MVIQYNTYAHYKEDLPMRKVAMRSMGFIIFGGVDSALTLSGIRSSETEIKYSRGR